MWCVRLSLSEFTDRAVYTISSWVLFINHLYFNPFKLAESIQAGGKKGKLFCNFWFAGGLCANCKCACLCAVACDKLRIHSFIFILACHNLIAACYK